MTVKSSVSFTDQHHQFAQNKTKTGQHGSISSVVAAGLEALMQDEAEREAALQASAQVIAKRLETPLDEWKEGTADLFAAARARLNA